MSAVGEERAGRGLGVLGGVVPAILPTAWDEGLKS